MLTLGGGGAVLHSTMDTVLASQPAAQGSILGYLKNFSPDVAEISFTSLLRIVDRGLVMSLEHKKLDVKTPSGANRIGSRNQLTHCTINRRQLCKF